MLLVGKVDPGKDRPANALVPTKPGKAVGGSSHAPSGTVHLICLKNNSPLGASQCACRLPLAKPAHLNLRPTMARLTKLNVARHQLGTALDLFIRDRDPIAVQCLACGGCEIIDKIATLHAIPTFSTHILETVPDLDIMKLRSLQRQYWNAFKHMDDRGGNPRDDGEMLASFDDSKNDAALFVGWWDYYAVTGRLPLPVQVFQIWFYALYENTLAIGSDLDTIRKVFPGISANHRTEQKRKLRRAVEKFRSDAGTLKDPRTEVNPLCFPASVFTGSG